MDSEPIAVTGAPDNMVTMFVDAARSIRYKMTFVLFMLFIVVSSDVFVNRILSRFNNAVIGKCAATWGVMIQAFCLCLAFVVLDALMESGVI